MPNPDPRATQALANRIAIANADAPNANQAHPTNNDESTYPDKRGNYSKGLKQTAPGIVDINVYNALRTQTLSGTPPAPGTPDFEAAGIVTGGKENGPQGAYEFQSLGFDSSYFGAPTVPAPPALSSPEYGVELIELYWASLLRDVAFTDYETNSVAKEAAKELSTVPEYAGPRAPNGKVTPRLLFRGGGNLNAGSTNYFDGEAVGPYISQFLITPTSLGAQELDQRINIFAKGKDYLVKMKDWYDVQGGKSPSKPAYVGKGFLHNGRGLATYTHDDELFQAYFVAHLILADLDAATAAPTGNVGSPYRKYKNQKPFGTFGGPDVAATLGAVAKAAINAVWYQKWVVHLRHRPEAGGGIVQLIKSNPAHPFNGSLNANILNSKALKASHAKYGSYLLSQAFPEGSPTHPAYPTGHGTVGGACITALKFFYDCTRIFPKPMVASSNGKSLKKYGGADAKKMTIAGELNKLAHNISFGHGIHAGIHWRSDTDYSMLLGEAVALQFLRDQARTCTEKFKIPIVKFDGTTETIANP